MKSMSVKIAIWNVEHGNAVSILTPNKKRIIKDLGANFNTQFSPISYLQSKYKVKKIDTLIVTHPHRDHIDDITSFMDFGFHEELRHFVRPMKIDRAHLTGLLTSYNKVVREKDQNKYDHYFDLHEKWPNTYITQSSPLHPQSNGGVTFEFFKPYKSGASNINNHSIVTVMTYMGKKILFTGDNEEASWKELLSNPKFRNSIQGVDVFLASHHGRPNGFCEELFNYFRPKLVIISDGPGEHRSAIKQYYPYVDQPYAINIGDKKKKRKCLITRQDNAIILTIKDDTILVDTR